MTDYGIRGDFSGDAEKAKLIHDVAAALEAGKQPSNDEIIAALEAVPFSGRATFINNLVKTPVRDAVVASLFECCFEVDDSVEGEADDDFMLVSCGGTKRLNTKRVYILKLLCMVIPRCGKLGVSLFNEYRLSTSTTFRSSLLAGMVKCKEYPDEELFESFNSTIDTGKATIIEICKDTPHRKDFIQMLVKKGLAPFATLYWCSSEVVSQNVEKLLHLGITNAKEHFHVFMAYLEKEFVNCGDNALAKSDVMKKFERHAMHVKETDHIMQMFDMCIKHCPLEIIATEHREDVKQHLLAVAKDGKLTDKYDSVQRYYPRDFIRRLVRPAEVLTQLSTVTPAGLVFKEGYWWLCIELLKVLPRSRYQLVTLCMDNLTSEDFKNVQKEKSAARKVYDLMLPYLTWGTMHSTRKSRDLLDSWIGLHLRNTPEKQGKANEHLWVDWFRCITQPFKQLMSNALRLGTAACGVWDKTVPLTGITSYLGYYRALLERLTTKCIAPHEKHLSDKLCIDTLTEVLASGLSILTTDDSVAVDKLREVVDDVLLNSVFPKMRRTLNFNYASKNYITRETASDFWRWCGQLFTPNMIRRNSKLRAAALDLMERTYKESVLSEDYIARSFIESVSEEGRVSFVRLNDSEHKNTGSKAKEFMLTVVDTSRNDDALAEKAWNMWTSFVLDTKVRHGGQWFTERQRLSMTIDAHAPILRSYLNACRMLPKVLLAKEKETLLSMGKHFMSHGVFQTISRDINSLGLTLAVLDVCNLKEEVKLKWILDSQDVSNAAVRKHLQEATTGSDMHVRMQAHVQLLTRSKQTNLKETAISLKYVSEKIRNEAGLTRPQVYDWVTNNIESMVTTSIHNEECIDVLTHALDKMLRDDISKRDTVAKGTFQRIAKQIMDSALSYNQMKRKLAQRRAWIVAAMNLLWLVTKTIRGEEEWKTYTWDIPRTYFRTHWLPKADLVNVLKPFLSEECRVCDYDTLRVSVYRENLYQNSADEYLTPADAVDLLVSALEEVRSEHYKLNKDNTWLQGSCLDTSTTEGFNRFTTLLKYTGPRWVEVPVLVTKFTESITLIEKSYTHSRLETTIRMFKQIRDLYSSSLWYELPLMDEACSALMRASCSNGGLNLGQIKPFWMEAEAGRGILNFEKLTDVQKTFVIANCPNIRKKAKTEKDRDMLKDEADTRTVTTVRKLLGFDKSFIFDFDVRSVLVNKRDDLLGSYIGVPEKEFYGINHRGDANSKVLYNFSMTPVDLSSTTGTIACEYSEVSLKQGMMRSSNTSARSDAIMNYVKSPTTSHTEVIDLLKDLSARARGDNGEADLSLTHIIESVVLSIFGTDAVWFILAYLLSPSVIASSPHRTTASILTNLTTWAPTRKVVDICGLLLNGARRGSLSMFLHKQILRMLSEAGTAEASKLFLNEWQMRKERSDKPDIVKEIVKLSVSKLEYKSSSLSDVAWVVVRDIAKDPLSLNEDTVLLLLLPVWNKSFYCTDICLSGFFLPGNGEGVVKPTDTVPDRHRRFLELCKLYNAETGQGFVEPEMRDLMCDLMMTLEQNITDPSFRLLVTAKKYTFSKVSVDLLGELKSHLMEDSLRKNSGSMQSPERFVVKTFGKMYATITVETLEQVIKGSKYTDIQRSQGVAIEEECKVNPYALHAMAFLSEVYTQLLDTPLRQQATVAHLTQVLASLRSVLAVHSNKKLYDELVKSCEVYILTSSTTHLRSVM